MPNGEMDPKKKAELSQPTITEDTIVKDPINGDCMSVHDYRVLCATRQAIRAASSGIALHVNSEVFGKIGDRAACVSIIDAIPQDSVMGC